jgi:hypothetical protein
MPRDPDRISVICGKLARLWAKYPDMRFFQMVSELQAVYDSEGKRQDPYYIEDDVVLKRIQVLLNNGIGGSKS